MTFSMWISTVCSALLLIGTYTGWQSLRVHSAIGQAQSGAEPKGGMTDTIAEGYVKLVLAVGQHDADYVDAYYGPPEWKKAAETTKASLDSIASRARDLVSELGRVPAPSDQMQRLRLQYL